MALPDDSRCRRGAEPEACMLDHVAVALPKGINGSRRVRLCPVHDDHRASLGFLVGDIYRLVWCCGSRCDISAIRAELLGRGVDETCLGSYGLPRRTIAPGMRVTYADPSLVADSKRIRAISKLPPDLDGKLYKMCVQAIIEGDGDRPPDPLILLGVNADDFYALADRAGIDAKYKYKLFKNWMINAA